MTRPTRTAWILTGSLCALAGIGVGSAWALGSTRAITGEPGAAPDVSGVSPVTEQEAARTVFVGEELDSLLLTDAELRSVVDLGVPLQPISNTFDRNLEYASGADPEDCLPFNGFIIDFPAGYRSVLANTSPSHSVGGVWFREQAFQFSSAREASEHLVSIEADASLCAIFAGGRNPEGTEQAPAQARVLASGGGDLPFLTGTTTVQAIDDYSIEWVMLGVGNVIVVAQHGHPESTAAFTDTQLTLLATVMRDRALRAAALVGDGDV